MTAGIVAVEEGGGKKNNAAERRLRARQCERIEELACRRTIQSLFKTVVSERVLLCSAGPRARARARAHFEPPECK